MSARSPVAIVARLIAVPMSLVPLWNLSFNTAVPCVRSCIEVLPLVNALAKSLPASAPPVKLAATLVTAPPNTVA